MWKRVKCLYNWIPTGFKWLIVMPLFIRLWDSATFRDIFHGRPLSGWKNYKKDRDTSPYYDVVEWVGGWPFEAAAQEEFFNIFRKQGFELEQIKTCAGGLGCNKYFFRSRKN